MLHSHKCDYSDRDPGNRTCLILRKNINKNTQETDIWHFCSYLSNKHLIKGCRLNFVTGIEPTPFYFRRFVRSFLVFTEQLIRNMPETNSKVIVN